MKQKKNEKDRKRQTEELKNAAPDRRQGSAAGCGGTTRCRVGGVWPTEVG